MQTIQTASVALLLPWIQVCLGNKCHLDSSPASSREEPALADDFKIPVTTSPAPCHWVPDLSFSHLLDISAWMSQCPMGFSLATHALSSSTVPAFLTALPHTRNLNQKAKGCLSPSLPCPYFYTPSQQETMDFLLPKYLSKPCFLFMVTVIAISSISSHIQQYLTRIGRS